MLFRLFGHFVHKSDANLLNLQSWTDDWILKLNINKDIKIKH